MATQRYIRIGLVVGALLIAAALLPIIGSSRENDHVRELRLVVRDMTYYVDGQDQPNPTLKFRAGERVKLVLRNDDEGMQHDFRVRTWDVGTGIIDGKGEDSVTFRVPARRGEDTYSCTPHPSSMRGTIAIE
jgi:Copper binding proteins, plastocyanin/azurin family